MNNDTNKSDKSQESGVVVIHGKLYTTVAKRLETLHTDKKLTSVVTEVLTHTPVVIRAVVVIEGNTYTGISSVGSDSARFIEKENPYEVAETSAVGRALAFAGYAGSEFPSADEMNKPRSPQSSPAVDEIPFPTEDTTPHVCSAHDEPIVMYEGKSKSKTDAQGNPKTYWWHKEPGVNGRICFGSGYKD